MNPFLSHLHTDLRRTRLTRRGATHAPDQVPRGTHKEYPRMERISLPLPNIDASLQKVLAERRSAFAGNANEPISEKEYGALLGHALRKREESTRAYPSGGGLYPVETYIIAEALPGGLSGALHYHPTAHALEKLWELPADTRVKSFAPKPDFLPFSALLVFTSVWNRSSAKYGDLAYQHALIEAGHMSENILLVATALGLRARPMAGFDDEALVRLLDLRELGEQPIHSVTLSKPEIKTIAAPESYDE